MHIGQINTKGVNKRKFKYSRLKGSSYHWTYVLRAKKEIREEIAFNMQNAMYQRKRICYSNKSENNADLYDDVKKHKFNIARLRETTHTNCCNLVSVCCRYAGLKTPRKSDSRTLHKKWLGFKVIKYKRGMKLLRGDVIVSTTMPKCHTAVIL